MLNWNTIKKTTLKLFKRESENMAEKSGVFIRSSLTSIEIIKAFKNLMTSIAPSADISSVCPLYGGFKIYFKGEYDISKFLSRKFLDKSHQSTIHPLITYLTVHNAAAVQDEDKFIQDLRSQFQNLGPVLEVSKIPIDKQYPDIGSGDWRIVLDIPEVEDLDVFKRNGLPDNFSLKVPSVLERLSVTFYCTRCEGDGHTQWRCSDDSSQLGTESGLGKVKMEVPEYSATNETPIGSFSRSHKKGETTRNDSSSTENHGRLRLKDVRQVECEIGTEEVRHFIDTHHLSNNAETNPSEMKIMAKRLLSTNAEPAAKRIRSSVDDFDDDTQFRSLPNASSTTNDINLIQVIYDSNSSNSYAQRPYACQSASFEASKNSAEDSVSTSNQGTSAVKSELPSTDENDSDSNQDLTQRTVQITPRRKKPAQSVPVVVPERIKNIISRMPNPVLDEVKMEAFLNHIKKKSRPADFAEKYTNNVSGLKMQLEVISREFYLIPNRGTNEEIQFMKWFSNVIKRYDGTPTTRKRKVPSSTAQM